MVLSLAEYQENCETILSFAWSARISVSITADRLAILLNRQEDASLSLSYIRLKLLAIHEFASLQPTSIDFLLKVFAKFCDLIPDSVPGTDLHGKGIGQKLLLDWLRETQNCGNSTFKTVPIDAKELQADPRHLMKEQEKCKKNRMRFIVSSAMVARCHALGILRGGIQGNLVKEAITAAHAQHNRWTLANRAEAEFQGYCMMMRGCGLTIMEDVLSGASQLNHWRQTLQVCLKENHGFSHRYQAVLALRNVNEGPWDEGSEELFDSVRWLV